MYLRTMKIIYKVSEGNIINQTATDYEIATFNITLCFSVQHSSAEYVSEKWFWRKYIFLLWCKCQSLAKLCHPIYVYSSCVRQSCVHKRKIAVIRVSFASLFFWEFLFPETAQDEPKFCYVISGKHLNTRI